MEILQQACTDRCAAKLVNINHRLISTYMEINPMNKKLAELEAQAQQEQQQAAELQHVQVAQSQYVEGTPATDTQGDMPPATSLATQVKDVFGEETRITDNARTAMVGSDSKSASLASDSKILPTDSSLIASQSADKPS